MLYYCVNLQVGDTPLHVACWSGNTDVVKVLLGGDEQHTAVNLPNMVCYVAQYGNVVHELTKVYHFAILV